MAGRVRARLTAVALGLGVVVLLAGTAYLTWIPIHRSPFQISDPGEPDLPPDFDVLLVEGRQGSESYVITLTVAGMVQSSGYDVFILGQEIGETGATPHVYHLEYQFGREQSYGTPTIRDGDQLTFLFPLHQLIDRAFIVGLEAMTLRPPEGDFVREGPRETLHIHRLLVLPFDSIFLVVASVTLAIALLASQIRASRKLPRDGHPG